MPVRINFRLLLLLVFLWTSSESRAQLSGFKNYSIEEGLSNSNATKFIQDKRGYLWIGTMGGGVNVFDGKTFKVYSKKNGLVGDQVRSLIEDSKGRIWIGTSEGLSMYNGVNFMTFDSKSGLKGSTILSLYEHSDGSIWAGTDDGGVNVLREGTANNFTIKTFTQKSGLSNNFVFDIVEGYDGKIWLATFYGGIDIVDYKVDTIHVKWLKGNEDLPSELIICIEKDGNGGYWIGSYDQGVFHLIPSSDELWTVKEHMALLSDIGDNTIWDVLRDRNGTLWVATNTKGLRKMVGNGIASYTSINGLPNNQLLSLFEDRESNIWIGTNGNGIARLSGEHFSHFIESSGFFLDQVYGIDQFNDGRMVLSSYGSGLAVQKSFHETVFDYYNTDNGLPGNYISSVSIDKDGVIWAATDKGVVRMDGKYIDTYTESTGLLSDIVNVIEADGQGVVWCGTKFGVSAIAGDRVLNITSDEGLIDNTVIDIFEDSKGNMWFATLGGLAKYDRQVLQTFDEVEGLTYKRLSTLCEGPEGDIWISTNGGGLFRLDVDSKDSIFIHPVEFSQLRSNSYTALWFYNDSTLIAGHSRGFDRITINADRQISRVVSYSKPEGFIGLETNQNAIFKTKNGDIWFGTPQGATRYKLTSEPKRQVSPLVNITGLKLFYRDVDWASYNKGIHSWTMLPIELELNYTEKQLTFEFAGISMTNPEGVTYRLFLKGADEGWSPPQTERQITYPGLSPGTYEFSVIAIDSDGRPSEPSTFFFTIRPPWYQTYWFYIICIIFISVIIYSAVRYRLMKLRQEKEHLEMVVAQRTAEVVQQKELIELKNKDITDSINYASRIQGALLPRMENLRQYFTESMILFMPKDIVSGDFYWFADRNEKVFFTAADCTGHGVPGAFMSMIGASLLNDSVTEKELDTPAAILNEVRQGIIHSLKQTGAEGEQKDGMDMALCAYSASTGILEYAGANNSLYILRKGSAPLMYKDGRVVEAWKMEGVVSLFEIKPSKMPVGYYAGGSMGFQQHELVMHSGDVVYSFSDGYADQFGGPNGKKFKYAALKQKLMSIANQSLNQQRDELQRTIYEWMGDLGQIDDICMVAVRL